MRKFERLERDRDFRTPSVVRDARFDVPHTIPTLVDFASFVGDLRIPLGAGRIDDELESVSFVVKCVEDNLKRIAVIDTEVLLQLGNDEPANFGIPGGHAE